MAKMQSDLKPVVSIFWFRRDLRLHDNHGLYEALRSGTPVLPLFIFDQNILSGLHDQKDKRVTFIHQTFKTIQVELESHGSSICIQYGKPEQVFEKLLTEFQVVSVYTNHDYEPYAIQRDDAVSKLLARHQIPFHSFKDQVIFEKSEVVKADGAPYT
ncbi:MAG TPA: deoxyribodipyrimidine photo-lyase, partial [Saprospiraceae bacterium]|nr:deoxyribodipyrimidine photo-lyase [Saprospiraceae bacterium]